jgi:hypothetical protein
MPELLGLLEHALTLGFLDFRATGTSLECGTVGNSLALGRPRACICMYLRPGVLTYCWS